MAYGGKPCLKGVNSCKDEGGSHGGNCRELLNLGNLRRLWEKVVAEVACVLIFFYLGGKRVRTEGERIIECWI